MSGVGHIVEHMTDWDDQERAALIALLRQGDPYASVVESVLNADGSARAALGVDGGLFSVAHDGLDEAMRDLKAWRADGYRVSTFMDRDFPAQLREIQEMPPILFWQGTLQQTDRAVSVVGTRRPTGEALDFARYVSQGLVDSGLSVVAGLALGIDTAAHEAALAAGGRTVAVIGTGIRRSYPPGNEQLQYRIAREGLLLSQFWPDAAPSKRSFPMRNAIMSGYGRASIIVEAGETSGTRIQARLAVAHGRPVILSRSVATSTSWGREYTGRPGVVVASDAAHAVELAVDLSRPLASQIEELGLGLTG